MKNKYKICKKCGTKYTEERNKKCPICENKSFSKSKYLRVNK